MNLKEIRLNKGLTQQQLADNIGVSRQQIVKWESGERNPKLSALKKLAKVLECDLMELIKE
jgi:transcriptional regulator with XRE-family HTH domain